MNYKSFINKYFTLLSVAVLLSSCALNKFSERKYLKGSYHDAAENLKKPGRSVAAFVAGLDTAHFITEKTTIALPGEDAREKEVNAVLKVFAANEDAGELKKKLIFKEDKKRSRGLAKPVAVNEFYFLGLLELLSFLGSITAGVFFFLNNPIWIYFAGGAILLWLIVGIVHLFNKE